MVRYAGVFGRFTYGAFGVGAPVWTNDYDGTGFGQLDTVWAPTGTGSILKFVMFHEDTGTIQQLLGPDLSVLDLSLSAANVLSFNLLANVEVDGAPATSGVTVVPQGYFTVTADIDSTADIKYIATSDGASRFFASQIHLIEITDTDTTSNSIVINNVIASATQPTDFNIHNELGSISTTNLVNNSEFDSSAGWNVNANWNISSGEAVADGTSSNDINRGDLLGVINQRYDIEIKINAVSQGGFAGSLGGGVTSTFNTVGIHRETVKATSTDRLRLIAIGNAIGLVDYFRIYENDIIIGEYFNTTYVPVLT